MKRYFEFLTRSLSMVALGAIMSGCPRTICNQEGQPPDLNPRNAAGVLDPSCPAYSVVGTPNPPCAEPPDKRCVYRAMGDCSGAVPGAACDVCADVSCGCSCPAAGLDGGSADAGCIWTCGR